jgi:hypothetical protein
MAKNEKIERAPRAKKQPTAAQKLTKERNIQAAKLRLVVLQARQKRVNEARSRGIMGSDDAILRLLADEETQKIAVAAQHNARRFVEEVLAGPHAERVRKWIGRGLAGDPVKVAGIIKNYLATQGFREAV